MTRMSKTEKPQRGPSVAAKLDEVKRGEVSPDEFLNREMSWLEFNRRVLHEALDERTPLLERAKFLSIFTSNLDEFYQKRVGGLKRQLAAGIIARTPDGRTPTEQLVAIRQMVLPMLQQQAACFTNDIRPKLREAGIHLLKWEELSEQERNLADRYFAQNVFPVLTPLAVDPGHPFPFISNLSTSLGVTLSHPNNDERMFARVKVPATLPQWVELGRDEGGKGMREEGNKGMKKESGNGSASSPQSLSPSVPQSPAYRFVSLIDIISHNMGALFPEMRIHNMMAFRITRNADVEREEEDAEDLLDMIEQELRERRFARIVRLEHGPNPDPWMRRFLMQELELAESDVYEMPGELDFTDMMALGDIDLAKLKYEPWTPTIPPLLADDETDIFSVIRAGDFLVHHPYESFNGSVERFVRTAALDPKVLAIKMTLYRTGEASPFIPMLIRAAETGKQVVVLVELKARFDEERNVQLAQKLEKAGVHVVYGVVGYKTHTKTTLIVRQETEGLRCYAHIGTGNYHAGTAKLYTDLGYFTCKSEITEDLAQMFNYLTGRSLKRDYKKLLVAPVNMEQRFCEMIERAIANQKAGRPAHIIAKMNSLEHRGICRMLYRASNTGVRIDLIVRGFCCLRPGVKGLSENIRVTSVIGRYLEHSRIFYFRGGAADPIDGEYYIGSADWMYRNLLARVEAITPIEGRALKERLWEILQIMLNDHRQAWEMRSDGSYVQRQPKLDSDEDADIGTHAALMRLTKQRVAG
ncbi:MAG: polyphosphate kinase 1 [Phycisphaerales bacterium]